MSSSEPFVIRPAGAGDRAAVRALVPRLRAFGEAELHGPDALDAGELRKLDQFFEGQVEGGALWVAEDPRGACVGMAYAEPYVDYFTREQHGHLGMLVVAEGAEGRGIGRALMDTVERWASDRGYRYISLSVFAANRHAIAIYERAGYRPDSIRYVRKLDARRV